MENEFIVPWQAVVAGIGIVIALILLAVLSLLQTSRQRREGKQRLTESLSGSGGAGHAPPGATPFFIARYNGSSARYFRVYAAASELLFLYAGPYYVLIDADTPRGNDQRHWLLRSLKLLFIALAGGSAAAAIGVGAILRGIARNAADNSEAARDILMWVLGIIAFLVVMLVICVPVVLWQITRRGRELDALPLSGLREQSELHKQSFRATRESVPDIQIDEFDQSKEFFSSPGVCCRISFKHARTGKWKIETLTTQDTRDAIQACLAIWGSKHVAVDSQLIQRLKLYAGEVPSDKAAIAPASIADQAAASPFVSASAQTKPAAPREKPRGGTFSMNGCGTMCVEARGEIDWGDSMEDSDSILAFCLFGVPIVPYRAVHTTDWKYDRDPNSIGGFHYRSIPIRWTWDLIALAYYRLVMVIGALLTLFAYVGGDGWGEVFQGAGWKEAALAWEADWAWMGRGAFRVLVFLLGVLMVVGPIMGRLWLGLLDRRHRDSRLLLGRHQLGSSDPVYWTKDALDLVRPPQEVFGTATYGQAVNHALAVGDYGQAMFAARLAAALESRTEGEQLTAAILTSPKVEPLLVQLRKAPRKRASILLQTDWQSEAVWAGHPSPLLAREGSLG